MGWYTHLINLTNGQKSKSEYKYGQMSCGEEDMWTENGWSKDDLIYYRDGEDGTIRFFYIPDGIEPVTSTTEILGTLNKRVTPWKMTLLFNEKIESTSPRLDSKCSPV